MVEALSALVGLPGGAVWKRGVERVVADVDPRNRLVCILYFLRLVDVVFAEGGWEGRSIVMDCCEDG